MVSEQFAYFMPILGFLFVFTLMYALLAKTKVLGENKYVHLLLSFVIAIVFVASPLIRSYTIVILPWFVVFVIAVFMIMIVIGFTQGKLDTITKPWFAWSVIIILILVFLIAAINVFSPVIGPYLPGGNESAGEPFGLEIKHTIFHPAVLGAILLFVVAAIASWILTKAK